ncbi:GyrI-like domain-containing protein [Flavobacterium sp.]|uniref:GyrI-like domain-containing protein n=1 Tax=Flavobacterium sp. TaxID=239 RepID=UPI00261B2959|nr:GyrI-like domain-containing protein [Flavobacterium sp.]MDG2431239.1 GyrI-like domain-containing protein [Flavobacterium sp.]
MKNKKILSIAFLVLFSVGLIWYLFIKKSDYTITFTVNAATGTVSQGIVEWSKTQLKDKNDLYTIIEKRNFDFIQQNFKNDTEEMEYVWELNPVDDSITKVTVGIKDLKHSLYNKVTVPFAATQFRTQQIEKIKNFKTGLEDHVKKFKIKIDGEGESKEMFVAYIPLKSVLQEKAQTMLSNDVVIVGYLTRNKIPILGYRPYLEVTEWDKENETVTFNYCFPIPKDTKYIQDKRIKFKTIKAMKGLKATYYGNYRTSDRAWFTMLDYAKRHDIQLQDKVLEHFLNNPFNGGNELEWQTTVIIPFLVQ